MANPLNPFLYRRLAQELGHVKIAREGEAMYGGYLLRGGRKTYEVANSGEYYRVNCPYCNDTRFRLWINHRWGVGAPGDKNGHMWWMLHCFNQECMKDSYHRNAFERRIYTDTGIKNRSNIVINPGEILDEVPAEVGDPGQCIPVSELATDHPAVLYLTDRGFDPVELYENYRLKYCIEANPGFELATGRLLAPLYMRGKYVAWQTRHIGEADWKRTPKYWTMPRCNKRMMLYDFDTAIKMPYVIITEGITDVWAVGPGAVAILGKSLHPKQMELILHHWRAAILLLDEDAMNESMETCFRLRQKLPTANVILPKGEDPASMLKQGRQMEMWHIIIDSCLRQGIDLQKLLPAAN